MRNGVRKEKISYTPIRYTLIFSFLILIVPGFVIVSLLDYFDTQSELEQMYPDESPPFWGGAILWRATSLAKPFRTDATMALIGHITQRVGAYPIAFPHNTTGREIITFQRRA